jgi:hypothetical protein
MIDPIMKVSDMASQEYSIELYMKSMSEELAKNRESVLNKEAFTKDDLPALKQFRVI